MKEWFAKIAEREEEALWREETKMVKTYDGEMYVIPKAFEEEIRADERAKCKCPYWNEEHQECATSFEEDIRADERAKCETCVHKVTKADIDAVEATARAYERARIKNEFKIYNRLEAKFTLSQCSEKDGLYCLDVTDLFYGLVDRVLKEQK